MERFDTNKRYKVFLVEEDDDYRERVISGLAGSVQIKNEPDYSDVRVDEMLCSAHIFKTRDNVSITLEMVPRENGTYFTIEDFSNETYDYDESEDV